MARVVDAGHRWPRLPAGPAAPVRPSRRKWERHRPYRDRAAPCGGCHRAFLPRSPRNRITACPGPRQRENLEGCRSYFVVSAGGAACVAPMGAGFAPSQKYAKSSGSRSPDTFGFFMKGVLESISFPVAIGPAKFSIVGIRNVPVAQSRTTPRLSREPSLPGAAFGANQHDSASQRRAIRRSAIAG